MKLPSAEETLLDELVGLVLLIRSVEAPSSDACRRHPAGEALYALARSVDETAEHLHDAGRRRSTFRATSCPPGVRDDVQSVRSFVCCPCFLLSLTKNFHFTDKLSFKRTLLCFVTLSSLRHLN